MTLEQWLSTAVKQLERAGIGTARLDALVLLADTLRTDKAQLLAHMERVLTPRQQKHLEAAIRHRAEHEPLAYIRGITEFYGRPFIINHYVLEPRPESETMIDMLKVLQLPPSPTVVDIGTGSGALAITAKLEVPTAQVVATDTDASCLRVARRNARSLDATITFLHGDLLTPVKSVGLQPSVLLCNLPYVPDGFRINPAAMREPRIAIFGGADGLDIYRKLFSQLRHLPRPPYILTEAMPPQHNALADVAAASGYTLERAEDFIQLYSAAV